MALVCRPHSATFDPPLRLEFDSERSFLKFSAGDKEKGERGLREETLLQSAAASGFRFQLIPRQSSQIQAAQTLSSV